MSEAKHFDIVPEHLQRRKSIRLTLRGPSAQHGREFSWAVLFAACGGSESELPSDAIDEDAEGIDSPVAIDSALALCDRPGLLFCEDFEFVQSPVGPPRSTRSGRCGFRRATASA